MTYVNQKIDYVHKLEVTDFYEIEDDVAARQINYARKHSAKALRQRSKKKKSGQSQPACGFSGRRNRRYAW